jgi:hypothetical protein
MIFWLLEEIKDVLPTKRTVEKNHDIPRVMTDKISVASN